MQHKRPMLKTRIQILHGYTKEDLRRKGAAAVFRAACSIRRSTIWVRLAACKIYFRMSFQSILYLKMGPASAADPLP